MSFAHFLRLSHSLVKQEVKNTTKNKSDRPICWSDVSFMSNRSPKYGRLNKSSQTDLLGVVVDVGDVGHYVMTGGLIAVALNLRPNKRVVRVESDGQSLDKANHLAVDSHKDIRVHHTHSPLLSSLRPAFSGSSESLSRKSPSSFWCR